MRRKVVRLTFPPPSKLHIKAPFTRSIFNASSLCFLHLLPSLVAENVSDTHRDLIFMWTPI
jgi:hypothetical protein